MENTVKIDYSFRQVATEYDFNYYIQHLQQPCYSAFNFIYLCFHGQKKCIRFADGTDLDLISFAEKDENRGIFDGRIVHFGSCSTLKMRDDDIKTFKQQTKARIVTGYTKDVDLISSFIFEAWLIDTIYSKGKINAQRLKVLVEKEMSYFSQKFGFRVF